MIKQYTVLALALVACLGLVLAAPIDDADNDIEGETMSNLALIPRENENEAGLKGPQVVFTEFCREAREIVQTKVTNEQDQLKSTIFNVVFTSGEDLARKTLESGSVAVQQLNEQLRNPARPIEESDESDQIQKTIDDGAKKIQKRQKDNLLWTAATIVKVMVARAGQVFSEQMSKIEQNLKKLLSPESIRKINDGCIKLKAEYFDVVGALFDEHRANLLSTAQSEGQSQFTTVLGQITQVDQLKGCGITDSLNKMKNFCSYYQVAFNINNNMSKQ